MKIAVAAVALLPICVVIALAASPRSDLPPAVWVAKDQVDSILDETGSYAQQLLRRTERALDDVSARVGLGTARASRSMLSRPARVIDGDTIDVGAVRVRLHGVDAPESRQSCLAGERRWPCGEQATRALAGRIGGRTVSCEERDRDRYGRVVAVCHAAGEDLNAWMVRQGWALAYRKYSRAYVADESAAKAARRGIWRGRFVAPWDWRRGERLAVSQTMSAPTAGVGCRIKGNISRAGSRIYHVPGGAFYDRTRIDTASGERWFCTESDARAAGWRRARR